MSDPFTGTISSGWDQISGTWSTSAGVLSTSNTSALIVHDTPVPANAGIWKVPTSGFSGGTFRLVAYLDANNYAYIEFAGTTLKLGYFSAGVETVLETRTGLSVAFRVEDDDQRQFRLCWDGVRLVGGYQNVTLTGAYTAPASLRPGLQTASSGSSWSWSGSAELAYHNEERGNCPTCATCWDLCETFPSTVEVYIPASTFSSASFTGTKWFCNGNCENLNNQTYVLTQQASGDLGLDLTAFPSGKTACPMYEYIEEDFCDIENPDPGRPGSYPATLRIRAIWKAGDAGRGFITVEIAIYSTCSTSGFGYGNITQYLFITPAVSSVQPLPSWDACVDVSYDTDVVGTGITLYCNPGITQQACDVDAAKYLTINL
jgi:hypothetical protein